MWIQSRVSRSEVEWKYGPGAVAHRFSEGANQLKLVQIKQIMVGA